MIPVLIAGIAAGVLVASTESSDSGDNSKEIKTRKAVSPDKMSDNIKRKLQSQGKNSSVSLSKTQTEDTSNEMELDPYQVVLSTIKDLGFLHGSFAAYKNAVAEIESDENSQYLGGNFQIARLDSKNCRCTYELYFDESNELQVCELKSKVFPINLLEQSVQEALPEGKSLMFALSAD